MKLVIGLGNPGEKYTHTRHNAGFLALDFYMKDLQVINCASKFDAQICELQTDGNKVFFVKPQAFMNKSGSVVRELVQFYKLDATKDILVIHDETDLPLGNIKTTEDSRAAGHNGVQNIFDELGTQNLSRIRIGVETRESRNDLPTDVFVLQNFTDSELETLRKDVLPKVSQEITAFLAK